jgi:hypothetical protein
LWHCQAEQERHATRPSTEGYKSENARHSHKNRADLMAILWQDMSDICMSTNIHNAPEKGNFCNEGGKAIKLQIVMDYIHYIEYVNMSGRMNNSYSTDWHKFKWIKNGLFSSVGPGHSQKLQSSFLL